DGTPGYIHSFTVAEVARGQAPPAAPEAEKPVEIPPVAETKPETFVKKTEEAVVPPVIAKPAAPAPTPSKPAVAARLPGKPRDSFSMVLARAGYFVAADPAYTDVYQNGPVYGGELRIGGKKLAGWLDGTYRAETGELTYTKEKTEVSVLTVQAGLLYRFAAGTLNPYAGAGIGYFMFKEKNEAIGRAEKNQAGFCLLGGVSWTPGGGFVVDARLKYEFCKMKPADFDIELGGLTAGLGLGFRF
ncbi:MAG: outer membrane beta-barrel protein, partial [Candidatus Aminicenantes bacterium]|nr:outer membrane beta-barrel protein [Candidatus Aminicenantes bacterium]